MRHAATDRRQHHMAWVAAPAPAALMRVWSGQPEFGVTEAGVVVVTDAAYFRNFDLHETNLGASMPARGERYTVG